MERIVGAEMVGGEGEADAARALNGDDPAAGAALFVEGGVEAVGVELAASETCSRR